MSESRDIVVPEGGDAVFSGRRLSVTMCVVGVLQGLPRELVSRKVILLSVLFRNRMGVRRYIVQFGSALMIFVM
jgi:hypothetical protein